jgi:hypothetical protein
MGTGMGRKNPDPARKKKRDRPCARKFSIAIFFAPGNFPSTLDCIFRALTPENEKFCSMYMHFVG